MWISPASPNFMGLMPLKSKYNPVYSIWNTYGYYVNNINVFLEMLIRVNFFLDSFY